MRGALYKLGFRLDKFHSQHTSAVWIYRKRRIDTTVEEFHHCEISLDNLQQIRNHQNFRTELHPFETSLDNLLCTKHHKALQNTAVHTQKQTLFQESRTCNSFPETINLCDESSVKLVSVSMNSWLYSITQIRGPKGPGHSDPTSTY